MKIPFACPVEKAPSELPPHTTVIETCEVPALIATALRDAAEKITDPAARRLVLSEASAYHTG